MINGASVDAGYEAVGSIRTYDMGEGSSCTATLISQDWIVTAEHCSSGGSEEEPEQLKPSQMFFQLGPNAHKPLTSIKLKRWISAPIVRVGGEDIQLDVSFAQLSRPITNVIPIPLGLDRNQFVDKSKIYEVVGYGFQSPEGYGSKSGTKQMAKYKVAATGANPLLSIFKSKAKLQSFLTATFPGEEADMILGDGSFVAGYQVHAWDERGRVKGVLTAKPAKGWSNTCNGDSGGPMIFRSPTGPKVVGIISGGFTGTTLGCVPLGSKISIFGPIIQREFQKIH